MPLRGYIKDGKYISVATGEEFHVKVDSPQFKAGDHDRQRKEFAKEIIQPYDQNGKPNEDFINAYPEIAKEKGMIGENNG